MASAATIAAADASAMRPVPRRGDREFILECFLWSSMTEADDIVGLERVPGGLLWERSHARYCCQDAAGALPGQESRPVTVLLGLSVPHGQARIQPGDQICAHLV